MDSGDKDILYVEDFYPILAGKRGQIKTFCPFCREARSNKRDRSLSVNTETLAYHCHYCDAKGYLKSKMNDTLAQDQRYFKPQPKVFVKPKPKEPNKESRFHDSLLEWFKGRGISEQTLLDAKITEEIEYMPQCKAKKGCIAFNYYLDDELINVKYRTREKDFKLVSGAQLIPYNINSIAQESYQDGEEKAAIIVEGEMDALTYLECGYTHVVSVPNGANKNLEYLDDFIDSHFEPLDVIYISTDNDRKGVEVRQELIRRFGQDKCRVIDYPSPCKDINEVLMQYGRDAVKKCVEEYTELKMEGIQELVDVESNLDFIFNNGLQKGATVGIPSLDKILSFKTGMLNIVTGVPSHGKALSLDTPLPTPSGWTTMGEVKLGDKLYDENGNICTVTFVTPIQYNRNCYRVVFSDKSEIICDEEHLWVTRDDKARRSEYRYQKKVKENGTSEIQPRGTDQSHKRTFPKMRTTKEIMDSLYVENGKRANHAIRVQGALCGSGVELPLHPYVLGLWLAEGTVGNNGITTGDKEIVDLVKSFGFEVTKRKDKYGYGVLGLTKKLRCVGVFYDKHIPLQYLRASIDDRLMLLKGLMDGDGTCHKDGTCSYSTSIKELADNVYELLMTMGVKATITSKVATCEGKRYKKNYNIAFRPHFNCFTLERKSCRIKRKYADDVNWRYIRKIEAVDSVPVKCIQVDSPNHMYLCGKSMIPTHNTFALNYLLARLNLLHGWKIAFFSPEFYPVSTHIAQVIETLGGQRFSSKNYTKAVYDVMKEYMCKNFFWIDPDDCDVNSVMERAKYLIRKKGIKALVIDPFNALTDKTKKNQKQDEYISDFLQKLRWFSRRYDCACFLVLHPTKLLKLENGLYPVCDLYNCKGASEIFDKADIGLTVWRNEPEDYAEIHVTKIKFRHLGEKGKAAFKFNPQNGRYVEIADPDELRRQGVDIRTMPVSWDNTNYILAKLNNQEEQVSFVLPSVEPQNNEFTTNDFDPFGSEDDSPF